jgi:vesicle-associated membrane protein 4
MMSPATATASTDDVELLHDHATSSERKELLGGGGGADDSEDEDFFLSGPKMGSKLKEDGGAMSGLQNQVREVTDIMRDNVSRMLDRGERLDELHVRSEALSDASAEFRSSSYRVQRKMWWQNTKAKMAMGGAGGVILLIIIIIAAS